MSDALPAIKRTAPMNPTRAFTRFLLGGLYFFAALLVAHRGAAGLVAEDWRPLVEQAMLVFLLLVGYSSFGRVLDRQARPVAQQGFPFRAGFLGEFGIGIAIGWAVAVACVLPIVVLGGLALHFSLNAASFGWLAADAAFFALGTLGVQMAFRGYPLQSAIRAIGEWPAVLMLSVLAGIWQAWLPGATRASMAGSITLALLLSMAYLRTRALWLPWGLHFAWVASRALLFGLPVNGLSSHSPVVQGDPVSAYRLAGSDFGLDGSWVSFVVLLLAMPFVYRATRDLSFQYNAPVLEPGGIPVDLDAAGQRQHEAATRPEVPEVKPLVQILPAAPTGFSVPPVRPVESETPPGPILEDGTHTDL